MYSPWQNGYAESFNGPFRDEFLNAELFTTGTEAQIAAAGSTNPSSRTRPSRRTRLWMQLPIELLHDHHSQKA
ncbi:transposase [Synechococcus sp. RSCCF101]|uniref:transposase n=1 Tax=Synechococcus sp. RSCCF101 TaxID=2511069 RepID=UPI001CD92713